MFNFTLEQQMPLLTLIQSMQQNSTPVNIFASEIIIKCHDCCPSHLLAGLDSLRRLQRLSLDHNQLVSTKGLKDVCTLLHLDCSYNHLASVEGLGSNILLRMLDLTSNSLSEVIFAIILSYLLYYIW